MDKIARQLRILSLTLRSHRSVRDSSKLNQNSTLSLKHTCFIEIELQVKKLLEINKGDTQYTFLNYTQIS